MTIKEIRKQSGLSQTKFAKHFFLSVRTLQEWEQERRECPEYVIKLINRIIELENTNQ